MFPPAVDLANTVVPGGLDLLADDVGLAELLAVEADRIPGRLIPAPPDPGTA